MKQTINVIMLQLAMNLDCGTNDEWYLVHGNKVGKTGETIMPEKCTEW